MKCRLALSATVRRDGVAPPVRSVSVWGLHKVGVAALRGVGRVVGSSVQRTLWPNDSWFLLHYMGLCLPAAD